MTERYWFTQYTGMEARLKRAEENRDAYLKGWQQCERDKSLLQTRMELRKEAHAKELGRLKAELELARHQLGEKIDG
jgi:hypothetical protein